MMNDESCIRLAGCRVLVIEDEALVAMLLEDALAGIGCEVVGVASRFYDAEQKARSLSFDVAVLDINLNEIQTLPIAVVLFGRGPFMFATGYEVGFLPAHLQTAPVLQKPFGQRELEGASRRAEHQNLTHPLWIERDQRRLQWPAECERQGEIINEPVLTRQNRASVLHP